jgi:tRNA A-37 threonylcarbamoyl transferase component Bud32
MDRTDQTGPHAGGGAAAPLPTTVGGFKVMRLLGEGGRGRIYEAEDSRLGRRVAVKVIRPELARDEPARQRFLREVKAVASLQHDNIVAVHQVGEDNGQLFLVMPVLAGESLQARLEREGRLPATEVVRIGCDSARGLAAAHAAGLIHRDVKPANLWLEDLGEPGHVSAGSVCRVKILDFGLVRPQAAGDGLSQVGLVQGTPEYMSPEQANGEPVDARSDLFSLGCVLYRAATGQAPFEGKTVTALLRAVAERQPPAPHVVNPEVPRGLSDLILRLLAKRPEDRPASAAEVAAALAGGSGLETTARERPLRPRRWRAGVAIGLVGLMTAGVAMWLLTRPGKPGLKVRYQGQIDVLVEREVEPKVWKLVRLDDPRALPLRREDKFRIEAKVGPPAYLYVVWVDPGKDVTPVYPWDPAKGWGTRPGREAPVERLILPATTREFYRAREAKPGVATMVLLARSTPLDVADDEVRGWFEALPDLPLPPGGERGVVWFDNYAAVTDDARRPRAFEVVASGDPFARWQGQMQKAVGDKAAFQTAVSFARTGGR